MGSMVASSLHGATASQSITPKSNEVAGTIENEKEDLEKQEDERRPKDFQARFSKIRAPIVEAIVWLEEHNATKQNKLLMIVRKPLISHSDLLIF